MNDYLARTLWGNTVEAYCIAIGMIVLGLFFAWFFKRILLARMKKFAEKTDSKIDDFIILQIERTAMPVLFFGIFYFALKTLNLSTKVEKTMYVVAVMYSSFFIIRMITSLIKFFLLQYLQRQEDGGEKQKQVRGIMVIVSLVVWMLGIVFMMDNLGFDVTAIITGLGIGGIAIALATQHILGDLFSYFVILFDRPFEIGDFIIVQDKSGIVEYVGIKTTRLRTLSGEQLVCSNTDLTNSRIHNYKRMERRRIVFNLRVTYNTPADKLQRVSNMIKEVISNIPGAQFDRAHFAAFGDYSLNFEVVYYVLTNDYVKYMDIQQTINLELFNRIQAEGIEFALPMQILSMQKARA
ncbi:mechanosensitive ion channel family protein [Chitinophaga skermanii]|nr:mechanosensitive ion channel family protein [Chitinophaga skermanii]